MNSTHSVVYGGIGYGFSVVRVKPGMETMRPLPVVVVAGPYTTREQAQVEADRLNGDAADVRGGITL